MPSNSLKDIFSTPNLRLIFFANFIEFADLYFFIHCAPMIAKIFIPPEHQHWMATFAISVAYGIPPLASIFFARLGDDWGRKITLILSSGLMLALTIVLTILPSYSAIGIWSLVIFCLIRFAQAISIAGEGACAWIYAYESTKKFSHTTFTIPFISLGEMLSGIVSLGGFLFLFHYFAFLGEETIIRFMFGILAILFAIILHNRKRMDETKAFIIERQKFSNSPLSFNEIYRNFSLKDKNWWSLVAIMALYPLGFTISYVFMGNLLKTQLGFSEHDVIYHNMYVASTELVLVFLTSLVVFRLEDRHIMKRKSSYLIISFVPLFCSIISYFYLSFYVPTPFKIWLIQVLMVMPLNAAFIIGNFYNQFAVIGRFSAAATAWSTARISGLLLGIWIMEYFYSSGSLEYFFIFTAFSILQIIGILTSTEPREEY